MQRDGRFPPVALPGRGDVRTALFGVVLGQGLEDDVRSATGHFDDLPRQFQDGEISGVAHVQRSAEVGFVFHERNHEFDQIVHVAKGSGLGAVAVDGDGIAPQGLHDEIGDHSAVVGVHARTIGVEQTSHAHGQTVLTVVGKKQGFGAAFALVVAGAQANGIDVAPVRFWLGVHGGVAVDLAGRGLKDFGPDPFGQAEHVDGAMHAGLGGLHRIELVVNGRGWAGQVVDFVHFKVQRKSDVVADDFKAWIAKQVRDVLLGAGEEIVHADDLVSFTEKPFAKVRSEKA